MLRGADYEAESAAMSGGAGALDHDNGEGIAGARLDALDVYGRTALHEDEHGVAAARARQERAGGAGRRGAGALGAGRQAGAHKMARPMKVAQRTVP